MPFFFLSFFFSPLPTSPFLFSFEKFWVYEGLKPQLIDEISPVSSNRENKLYQHLAMDQKQLERSPGSLEELHCKNALVLITA